MLMRAKIILLVINIFVSKFSIVIADENNFKCQWDNKLKAPCVEIEKEISNSSKLTKNAINKIIYNRKKIEESGAIDLIDVLKNIPDINITQSGPKGQQASIFMRGAGSNHTLVMINGIPINDQSTTQGLHDFGVDFVQTIQQIEVYPGSSGTNFGTNAIGGAINIILTGDYKDSISISSDNNFNYELFGNKTFFKKNSSLNIKAGSVYNNTISAKGGNKDEKDALKNYTLNINYENFLNNNSRIFNTLYLRQTQAEYDNSNIKQNGYEGDNKMASYQFGLENKKLNLKNNYVFYYNTYDREYDERGTIDTYKSNVIGLKYDTSKTLNNNISVGFGSEYKYDWGDFDNNGSYSASTKGNSDNLSLYGNLGVNIFKNKNISLFGRKDKHKQTGSNNTYKVNLQQNYNKGNVGLSYMNGLRNPTLYEMFGTDSYGYSGNRDLKPEKSNTYEVYSNIILSKNLNLSIRAFKSNIKNNIEYIDNKYQNDTDNIDLNQSGVNSEITYNFKKTNLSFFSSFLSSKKENESDQLRRPEKNYGLNLNGYLDFKYLDKVGFNIIYNHYGKHFDTHSTSFNTVQMDSTDLVDIILKKKYLKKIIS